MCAEDSPQRHTHTRRHPPGHLTGVIGGWSPASRPRFGGCVCRSTTTITQEQEKGATNREQEDRVIGGEEKSDQERRGGSSKDGAEGE